MQYARACLHTWMHGEVHLTILIENLKYMRSRAVARGFVLICPLRHDHDVRMVTCLLRHDHDVRMVICPLRHDPDVRMALRTSGTVP